MRFKIAFVLLFALVLVACEHVAPKTDTDPNKPAVNPVATETVVSPPTSKWAYTITLQANGQVEVIGENKSHSYLEFAFMRFCGFDKDEVPMGYQIAGKDSIAPHGKWKINMAWSPTVKKVVACTVFVQEADASDHKIKDALYASPVR